MTVSVMHALNNKQNDPLLLPCAVSSAMHYSAGSRLIIPLGFTKMICIVGLRILHMSRNNLGDNTSRRTED